jgi:hypothetical protein
MTVSIHATARLAAALLLAGCAAGRNTQLPTFSANDPNSERAGYQVHDPLPERELGGETSGRPRGFDAARSEPRRAVDKSLPVYQMSGRSPRSLPAQSAQVVQP